MEDKKIVCVDCGKEFVFTVGEQEFYKEKGFQNVQVQVNTKKDTMVRSAIRVQFTSMLPLSLVKEEKGCTLPIRSKPALQNAETETKIPLQTPPAQPYAGIKRAHRISAPAPSKAAVPNKTCFMVWAATL